MQSVPIITKVVSSNRPHDELYVIQHYVIKFVGALRWFSQSNKTERHDITEILLKEVLNTISP